MEIDSTSIAMLITLLILVVLSAYFSATETAFTSLNRIRLKTRADNGSRRAAKRRQEGGKDAGAGGGV